MALHSYYYINNFTSIIIIIANFVNKIWWSLICMSIECSIFVVFIISIIKAFITHAYDSLWLFNYYEILLTVSFWADTPMFSSAPWLDFSTVLFRILLKCWDYLLLLNIASRSKSFLILGLTSFSSWLASIMKVLR